MSIGAQEIKEDLIESVARRVRGHFVAPEGDGPERFVRQFYANVPSSDLAERTQEALYGAALSLWNLAEQRVPGSPNVRVYNPRQEEHGWHSPHTIVELVTDDMPFLVDSVTAALGREGAELRLVIHPIVRVLRERDGRRTAVLEPSDARPEAVRESCMSIELAALPAERHVALARVVTRVLADVRSAVEDWRAMTTRCEEVVRELEARPLAPSKEDVAEAVAFLQWILQNHFTFLGYREYAFEGERARAQKGTGLGLLRRDQARVFDGSLTMGPSPGTGTPPLVRITKANLRSTVHRAVPMDTIGVKRYDDAGAVVGEHLFLGLFTSDAYARSPLGIPLVRRKVQHVLQSTGLDPMSHDSRRLRHVLETYPRDELFQMEEQELHDISMGVMRLQERQRIALFVRLDPFERFASCLVYVPRDRYDTALRLRIQEILCKAFEGTLSSFYTHMTDEPLARLHLVVRTTPGKVPPFDHATVEQRLIAAGRSWADRLEAALVDSRGEERGLAAFRRFGAAFPSSYRDLFDEESALHDIERLEEVMAERRLAVNLYRPIEEPKRRVRFKIYGRGQSLPLSRILPMLENMGISVDGEARYVLHPAGEPEPLWIRDFEMEVAGEGDLDLAALRENFHDAFRQVWNGELENDGFNQLVLQAGLTARQLTVLRACCKYLMQARAPFSQAYMEEVLSRHAGLARRLVDLFRVRFDPDADEEGREARAAQIRAEVLQGLEAVTHLDEDRILRRFLGVIDAALRTNWFRRDAAGRPLPYLSIKFDSKSVPGLPAPRPLRDVFVYSPHMEGIHLRGGMVARGGIRWSDRREDFRTEVLGLMKAQMVKNAVIVPVGSKGGFVLKRPPGAVADLKREVVDCYCTLIRGLLDVTDNYQDNAVVPPPRVVRVDGDDPYLVVAADKGTATFSDIANGISREYGFWLDDAFASGGSAGYDHKKMGITAKGGWECVKRHFREMGKDIQREDFTVVGVGDMAGDVFGNGMLLSPHIRLVAAFNHQHVFLDPDPDPATSLEERQRLFDLPASTWADYDRKRISEGGGVYPRSAKSITLSPQAMRALGVDTPNLAPAEVIQAILRASVDLLWLGGIGTFARASDEIDAEVGDRANDALRVTAAEVRAKVVGEGANLGFTQRARIEYGLQGGRINTDAIDNSAGVDCSDHEVNLKILLGEVERSGDLTRKQRDELLRAMTDDVAEQVLRDNYLQTQSITVTHRLGAHLLDRLGRFMRALEKDGRLDRRIEFLPDDEALAERLQEQRGLSRPEIAVLLAYAKIALYGELLASDLPDDPALEGELSSYFPATLVERFPDAMRRHGLRREITATVVTNSIVNRVGVTFVHEVREKTGMPSEEIARGYLAAREIFGLRATWRDIEALDNHAPAQLQATLLAECGRLIEATTVWLLRAGERPLDVRHHVETLGPAMRQFERTLPDLIGEERRLVLEARKSTLVEQGAPAPLAARIACLPLLAVGPEIARVARETGQPLERAAQVFLGVGTRHGFDWLRRAAGILPADTAWSKLAISALLDDLQGNQAQLATRVLQNVEPDVPVAAAIEAWVERKRALVGRAEQILAELQAMAAPDITMLAVASRQLKSLSL